MFTANYTDIQGSFSKAYASFVTYLGTNPFGDGEVFFTNGMLMEETGKSALGMLITFEVANQKKLIEEWSRDYSFSVKTLQIVASQDNGQTWYTGAIEPNEGPLIKTGFNRSTVSEAFQDAVYLAFQLIEPYAP